MQRLQETETMRRIQESASMLITPNLQGLALLMHSCLDGAKEELQAKRRRKTEIRQKGFAAMARLLADDKVLDALEHRPYLERINREIDHG